MNQKNNNIIIEFDGQQLLITKTESGVFTAVKTIVEGMGLDWSSQSSKLSSNKDKFNYGDIAIVANDRKQGLMGYLPLRKFNGWQFSINPEKVKLETQTVENAIQLKKSLLNKSGRQISAEFKRVNQGMCDLLDLDNVACTLRKSGKPTTEANSHPLG